MFVSVMNKFYSLDYQVTVSYWNLTSFSTGLKLCAISPRNSPPCFTWSYSPPCRSTVWSWFAPRLFFSLIFSTTYDLPGEFPSADGLASRITHPCWYLRPGIWSFIGRRFALRRRPLFEGNFILFTIALFASKTWTWFNWVGSWRRAHGIIGFSSSKIFHSISVKFFRSTLLFSFPLSPRSLFFSSHKTDGPTPKKYSVVYLSPLSRWLPFVSRFPQPEFQAKSIIYLWWRFRFRRVWFHR